MSIGELVGAEFNLTLTGEGNLPTNKGETNVIRTRKLYKRIPYQRCS